MRAIVKMLVLGVACLGLGACETLLEPTAAPPHSLASLPGNWQVGASEMHDSKGRAFAVCTLLRTGEGDRRFWIAGTRPDVSTDLYIGVRAPDLPKAAGTAERHALIAIDGREFRPTRTQHVGTDLSMAIPAGGRDAFLDAFAKGGNLSVTVDEVPGFMMAVGLNGSANGRREWRNCLDTELAKAS
ncbi:hypothetical protein L2U69_17515 [Zavarzinia compransoris]|uniref:hypothetical protein n=1 Tax=Zavarzinia marina TaxID=2911065 RepID=UPI001F3EB1B2|nr:hypothetical protein [Zavarzinia marina]MCF4167450.1 hypothetical protein [Zavarzinia marina]